MDLDARGIALASLTLLVNIGPPYRPLTAVLNNVTVVPTPGYSACLPAAVAGEVVVVNNQSSRYLSAFPNGTDSINGGAASASVNLPSGALALFTAAAANKWQVTTYLTGTSGDILTFDSTLGSTGYAHDGGLLTGDCTSVALVVSCTSFSHVLTLAKPIVLQGYTVSTLPSSAGQGKVIGARAYVTDATSCTYMGALTGGGSTYCPVTFTGSAWVAG